MRRIKKVKMENDKIRKIKSFSADLNEREKEKEKEKEKDRERERESERGILQERGKCAMEMIGNGSET